MNKLKNLCQYYLECVRHEAQEVSVFADSKYDVDYAELTKLPDANGENFGDDEELYKLQLKINKDQNKQQLKIYFGYPCLLKEVTSKKSNWKGFVLEPLFLFPVNLESEKLKIDYAFPSFNFSAIKSLTKLEHGQLLDQVSQLEEGLHINSGDKILKLGDIVEKLKRARSAWAWKEPLSPEQLSSLPPIKEIKKEGIYNKAVYVIGKSTPFTMGLKRELGSLSTKEVEEYEHTILGRWIKGELSQKLETKTQPLLEVLPINSEQRQAIQSSLENSLTVITGPPGTGKSQVVTNLLINAAYQGKNVLFASKNNKAVDVVATRINNLGKRSTLVRVGAGEYQNILAKYLIGLLTQSYESEQEKIERENLRENYEKIESRFFWLDEQESKLIKLRNKTDHLDKSVERISRDISAELFENLKNIEFHNFKDKLENFQRALNNFEKDERSFLPKWIWSFITSSRYKNFDKAIKNIQDIASILKLNLSEIEIKQDNIHAWRKIVKKLEKYFEFTDTMRQYRLACESLQEAKSLEEIAKEKIYLTEEITDSAEKLWDMWLRSSSSLSDEDRKMLTDYKTSLEMVIDGGLEKLEKDIYNKYVQLTTKVAHLIPVWAVTSLSASRIPLDAGYFDIVVFDEASQCDIASAIPLLYRAKRAVVIGDVKQLKHISHLKTRQDQQLLKQHDLTDEYISWTYSTNSLFDLACRFSSKEGVINLIDHHRSHPEIIEFSNREFYGGHLRVVTNYKQLKAIDSEKTGVRWVNVSGMVEKPYTGGAVNRIEATSVCEQIEEMIDKNYAGSIGVVTPFREQAKLIHRTISTNDTLKRKLINSNFLVDTVHKFQGDERDVMIFSPVVSKDMPAGALNFMKNNGNLFNVAITRARAILLVVGDQHAAMSSGISYLENFANYARQLETKTKEEVINSIKNLGAKYPTVTHPQKVSEWEHILYEALYRAGIKTIPQYPVEKYTLDLALFAEDESRCLDIEVDGEHYHKDWTGELCRRDQIRNQRLYELGWHVKRFWVYEIRDNLDNCVEQIKQWVTS